MSYQVLARKWRPRTFHEMVGQEHVLQALVNALDHDRLHHAYLFTGTRGVGKTTIGRILAKCLNCEVGVSSVPCNQCSACSEINEGRFVDLIEVDAASRTKVEDTRELLENVQYAPTRGRYKVYLIDEVHMLSNSSFNALLKTLEEPPPHVKFLLATTDPHKLPVTILSRCLQFNLKNMNPERIVSHLEFVLGKEMVPFEESALWQLARSADGSMRDALSLTDQSIAFGDGKVSDADVRAMLGTIDQSLVYKVIEALIAENGQALLVAVAELAEHAPDYSAALAELIATFHRVAIAQAVPEAIDNSQGDRQKIYDFAQEITAEDIQLYYQTALLGRRDLPLVPDLRSGFEMILLRMLAFKPQGVAQLPKKSLMTSSPTQDMLPQTSVSQALAPAPADIQDTIAQAPLALHTTVTNNNTEPDSTPPWHDPGLSAPANIESVSQVGSASVESHKEEAIDPVKKYDAATEAALYTQPESTATESHTAMEESKRDADEGCSLAQIKALADIASDANVVEVAEAIESVEYSENQMLERQSADIIPMHADNAIDASAVMPKESKISFDDFSAKDWVTVYLSIQPGGLLQSTAANTELVAKQGFQLHFVLDHQQSTLYDNAHQQRLAGLLSDYFAIPVEVLIVIGDVKQLTPAQIILQRQKERQRQAELSIEQDPLVKSLQELFDASIVAGSIIPID